MEKTGYGKRWFEGWRRDLSGADPAEGRFSEGRFAASHERPELLALCGAAGVAGGVALVVLALVAGAIVPNHDPVAETLSDLAGGPSAIWMDLGFYLQAVGLVGLAVGAAHAHLGRWGWSLGVVCLLALGLVVTLLGLFDDFHDGPVPFERYTVHTRLTFLLVPLYVIGPLAMAAGAARVSRVWGTVFVGSAIATAVLGPVFFLVPTSLDGLVERILVLPGLVWSLSLSAILLGRARERARAATWPLA